MRELMTLFMVNVGLFFLASFGALVMRGTQYDRSFIGALAIIIIELIFVLTAIYHVTI